jgi:hypothetical protein
MRMRVWSVSPGRAVAAAAAHRAATPRMLPPPPPVISLHRHNHKSVVVLGGHLRRLSVLQLSTRVDDERLQSLELAVEVGGCQCMR